MQQIFEHLRAEMTRAQAVYEETANRRRTNTPNFQIGDLVFLDSKNISTRRPSRKLEHKKLGPFKIIEKMSTHAYRLELPQTMACHDVFHVSRLRLCPQDPYPGQSIPPPPPVIVDGEEEFFIEEILDSRHHGRGKGRRLQYLVKWLGYDQPSWEPAEYLERAEAVDRFHSTYPDKPGASNNDGG